MCTYDSITVAVCRFSLDDSLIYYYTEQSPYRYVVHHDIHDNRFPLAFLLILNIHVIIIFLQLMAKESHLWHSLIIPKYQGQGGWSPTVWTQELLVQIHYSIYLGKTFK